MDGPTCLSAWHSIVFATHWCTAIIWLVDGPSDGHCGACSACSSTIVFAPITMAGSGRVTLCAIAPLQNVSLVRDAGSAGSQPHS